MTRYLLTAVLALTCTLVGSDVATAASKPALHEDATVSTVSASDIDFTNFSQTTAENSSQLEPGPGLRLEELTQVFVPMSWACYTPVGACRMGAPAPVGSSCYCVFPGGTFWGTVQ